MRPSLLALSCALSFYGSTGNFSVLISLATSIFVSEVGFQGKYAHFIVNHIIGFAVLGPQPVNNFSFCSLGTENCVMF